MAEETQYTANTGMVTISTANTNLDGTGTLGTVLTGASNGTLVKSITIKAITNTTAGMVRLFVTGGGNTRLLMEIPVPAINKAAINAAFETKVDLNFTLQSGYIIKASTQNNDRFNIIAEGLDWAYYGGSVRKDTTKLTSNMGLGVVSVANSNLDGTGDVVLVYAAGSAGTPFYGSSIKSITIKAPSYVSSGMVRLYLDDGTGSRLFLFSEVVVPTDLPNATDRSFEHTIIFENDFDIQAGYCVYASTENSEYFNVAIEGNDWNYV
jgi:hypothetical protein